MFFDINCDLGEGITDDAALLPLISSCNIACGGHAGDEDSIEKVVRLALDLGVKIGAHPSFPDPENFGRVAMDMPMTLLKEHLSIQLRRFRSIIQKYNARTHHIKPHGALYHLVCKNKEFFDMFVAVIEEVFEESVPLYLLAGSNGVRWAKNTQIPIFSEAFGDRRYHSDMTLVQRSDKKAIISAPHEVWLQVKSIMQDRMITTIEGDIRPIHADTICIHGDHPGSLLILEYLVNNL